MESLSKELAESLTTALRERPEDFTLEVSHLKDEATGYAVNLQDLQLDYPYQLVFDDADKELLIAAIGDFKLNHVREKFNKALMAPEYHRGDITGNANKNWAWGLRATGLRGTVL